jgi:hypothetical protein
MDACLLRALCVATQRKDNIDTGTANHLVNLLRHGGFAATTTTACNSEREQLN